MHRVEHPYEYNEHNAAKKTCKAAELSIVAVGFFRVCTLLAKVTSQVGVRTMCGGA